MKKNSDISRRDFINGVALSVAAGSTLSPLELLAESTGRKSSHYPPALTGMRGSHDGSFEIAHAIAQAGKKFARPKTQTDETYDLIVVGGGISGLSSAKFFRDRRDGPSKILVLDNHDDFGGHARRNEFDVDGKKLLCYGGSQSLEAPSKYSKVAAQLLRDLSVDTDRFYDYFDDKFFSSRGMKSGIYFDRSAFGVDRLQETPLAIFRSSGLSGQELFAAVGAMPISEPDQRAFVRLLSGGVDYLEGMSVEEKVAILRQIDYLSFLKKYAEMPESVVEILRDSFLPIIGTGWEAETALEAAYNGFPGTWELDIPGYDEGDDGEPYIFHFPDGNASIARLLIRDLIPSTISGSTMEDIVTATADYSMLDCSDSDTRVRLNSTVVNAVNTPDGKHVDITYVSNGQVHRARTKHAVLACYNNIIPYICPETPEKQVDAIRYATKVPFVVGSFAIRNWQAFVDAGFSWVYSPGDVFFKHLFLDFPVSLGDYHYPRNPNEPIAISAWHSPTARGLSSKDQYRAGREKLMRMSFDDFENGIISHLDGMLGPHGFDAEREIAAITLNRWSHGYAYEFEGLGVPADYSSSNGPHIAGRAQIGRISIANSDSEARAYVDGAIDAADRAVGEQLS